MKMYAKLILSYLLLFLCLNDLFAQYTEKEEYLLRGDAVRVTMWHLWDISSGKNPISAVDGDYVIDPYGNIFMPFVGLIRVAGVTPDQLVKILEQK